jgi:GDSL-like lipase/acylhydrolase family protein
MSVERNPNAELRIAGFGACMIGGYPHKAGGMFEVACALIERRLSCSVRSKIVSLGGFPAPRAEKYLKRKVLDFNPDYVVIQFGSTDARCSIRDRSTDNPILDNSYPSRPASMLSRARWELASLLGYLWKPASNTPLVTYIAAIEGMARDCIDSGATPVVLAPFVYGSRYSTRSAVVYSRALRDLSEMHDLVFVDCMVALRSQPKSIVLEHDGFHLSLVGHSLVAKAIALSIIADVNERGLRTADMFTSQELANGRRV